MNTLTIAPLQWSDLKYIDDVEPINDGDTACLIDIRDVLKKHGKMDRFGVALLHSHFALASDEIMLESSDNESRTLINKPIKQSHAGANDVGTIWMLGEGGGTVIAACRRYCRRWGLVGHDTGHDKS